MDTNSTQCHNDNDFGTIVAGCRDDFDFKFGFEQIFLSITPSAFFLLLSIIRIWQLRHKPRVLMLRSRSVEIVKLTAISIYAALQLAMLVLICRHPYFRTTISITATSLAFLNTLVFAVLSVLEHSRSRRTSILFNTYLFFSLLFDIVQARTRWLIQNDQISTNLFTAAIGVKVILLIFEAQGKERWMSAEEVRSPEVTSGVFNLSLFAWLNRLIIAGYRKVLSLDDLYALDDKLASASIHTKFRFHWQKVRQEKQKYKLLRTTFTTLKWPYLAPIIPRVVLIGFTFCQPFLITSILRFIEKPFDTSSRNIGYRLIGAAAIVYLGIAVTTGFYWHLHQRALTMTRACLVSAIYQHMTSLNMADIDNSAPITLMSTDIGRIQGGFRDIHECWANVIEVALATWLLERELGVACVAPIAVVILCVIATICSGKFAGKRQGAWMTNLEKRVGVTSSAISQMTSLKMAGLADQVTSLIQILRTKEIVSAKRFRLLNLISTVIAFTPLLISPVVSFAVTSRELNTAAVFTSLAYLLLLANPLTQLFQSVPQILASVTCFDRVEKFLLIASRQDMRKFPATQDIGASNASADEQCPSNLPDTKGTGEIACTIQDGYFGWIKEKYVLEKVNLQIPKSSLTMIVGPIASGKSTLCKAILGELPIIQGELLIPTNFPQTVFCEQDPFLKNATIRENIIGPGTYDSEWYSEVIDSVDLRQDFNALPMGESSVVGTDGVTLSGGQRQRVALARALYSRPHFAIFDDVFSGMDSKTEEHIFRRVFGADGILTRLKSTVILSTHSVHHLPSSDHIVALSANGFVLEQGSFERLMEKESYVHGLEVTIKDNVCKPGVIEAQEQLEPSQPKANAEEEESKARQQGDIAVYYFYFSTIGLSMLAAFVTFGMAFGFLYNFPSVWLAYWADANGRGESHTAYYLGIYTMLQILCLCILACFCAYGDIITAVKASSILHQRALITVINAPLSFFSAYDVGVTTNRFSQDISMIDNDLPNAFSNTVLTGFTAVGQAAVIASSSPYVIIGYPVLVGLLYGVQKTYLRTSRQLRFLDLEAKAPLYTHFLETLKGLSTLRVFGWIAPNIALNHSLLDTSQRPMYLLAMIQQWLTLVLNMTVAVLAIVLISLATQLRTSPGFTGVGLVTLMSFGQMLANLVQCWTELETSTGALSRLKGFGESVVSENLEEECERPGKGWPHRGEIEINGVSATYENFENDRPVEEVKREDSFALKDINLSTRSGERIAVCGRTGCGKSSLILLLLRFLNASPSTPNNITIDGLQLHLIHRPTLRSRIIAIPQKSFLLPGGSSFLKNLTLSETSHSIDDCQYALESVKLWDLVVEQGGLNGEMKDGSLSHGQKQLFCLARAIVRARIRRRAFPMSGGVLLLDEVNSSVDRETDVFMQEVLKKEFESYTVICVAHRLQSIMDYDRIVVMERGGIVEVGKPTELVNREGSKFREQWLIRNEN